MNFLDIIKYTLQLVRLTWVLRASFALTSLKQPLGFLCCLAPGSPLILALSPWPGVISTLTKPPVPPWNSLFAFTNCSFSFKPLRFLLLFGLLNIHSAFSTLWPCFVNVLLPTSWWLNSGPLWLLIRIYPAGFSTLDLICDAGGAPLKLWPSCSPRWGVLASCVHHLSITVLNWQLPESCWTFPYLQNIQGYPHLLECFQNYVPEVFNSHI